MPCWDLGDIGTHAGAICPDPAKIPVEYAVVRLLTSIPTLLGEDGRVTCQVIAASALGSGIRTPTSLLLLALHLRVPCHGTAR